MELKGKWIEGNWASPLSLLSFPQRHLRFLTPLTLRQVACWPWHIFITERDLKERSKELQRAEGTAARKAAPVMHGSRDTLGAFSHLPPASIPCLPPVLWPSTWAPWAHSLGLPMLATHSQLLYGCFLAKSHTSTAVRFPSNALDAEWTSISATGKPRTVRASPCNNLQKITKGLLAFFKFKNQKDWHKCQMKDKFCPFLLLQLFHLSRVTRILPSSSPPAPLSHLFLPFFWGWLLTPSKTKATQDTSTEEQLAYLTAQAWIGTSYKHCQREQLFTHL